MPKYLYHFFLWFCWLTSVIALVKWHSNLLNFLKNWKQLKNHRLVVTKPQITFVIVGADINSIILIPVLSVLIPFTGFILLNSSVVFL